MHERSLEAKCPERGLSVLELLTVVAVVGLLAVLLVPSLVTSVRNAREARAIANARAIAGAEMAIYTRDRRFVVFEELFASGAIPPQFEREAEGGGRRGSATEVVSDGTYLYSMRFDRDASGITIDADPRAGYVGTHRWFRLRVGRTARGPGGGEMLLYAAEPSSRPPPARAYRPLGSGGD